MFHREGEIEGTRQFENDELRGGLDNSPVPVDSLFPVFRKCGLPSGEPEGLMKSLEAHSEDQTIPKVQLC